jgi:hypothetical protein
VDDQEALHHASIDCVRECFRALVRSFEPSTCIVLNAQKVQMLADLTFSEDEDDFGQISRFLDCRVTSVDIFRKRPNMTRDDWHGFRDFETVCLERRYPKLDSHYYLDELSD